MAGIPISTAGITLKYAVETTAGTRPTTGYTQIKGITNIGDINPEPNMLDCTELTELVMHQYIPGLKDMGGAITVTANLYDTFMTAWQALVTASQTAAASGLATWFEIVIPGQNSFYVAGVPSELGFSEAAVDEVLQVDAYIAPTKWEGYAAASN